MNCETIQELLHGYVDHELEPATALKVELHLKECDDCRMMLGRIESLRTALRSPSLRFVTPVDLQQNIRVSIGALVRPRRMEWLASWKPWTLAASLALVALAFWRVTDVGNPSFNDELVTQELIDTHIRSLMPNHLIDVSSTDQHTVKPWFNGKVDFSPTVRDLTGQGFVLVGGRLDYVGGSPFAVIVYKRRLHVINLFTHPVSNGAKKEIQGLSRQGYHLLSWNDGKMDYWAVSDLDEHELHALADLYR